MKPKIAFFDFASCEGCQLQVANLEESVIDVADVVDVVEFREVMTEKAETYDIAFI
jgi:sulfhydrogenase subunit delta